VAAWIGARWRPAPLTGFENVRLLGLTPDGRTLAALGLGARPLFFSVHERRWPAVACQIADRDVTRAVAALVGVRCDYEPTCPA
jgi:hypothetical protein